MTMHGHCLDWQLPESYRPLVRLTRRQWAWEFLRRNPIFREELISSLHGVEETNGKGGLQKVRYFAELSRWGVLFRRF